MSNMIPDLIAPRNSNKSKAENLDTHRDVHLPDRDLDQRPAKSKEMLVKKMNWRVFFYNKKYIYNTLITFQKFHEALKKSKCTSFKNPFFEKKF